MIKQECAVCNKPASQCCSNCNVVYYCTRDHQKSDWKNHKNKCAPYKIERNDVLGRYLIATRNIKAGEIIMKKSPIVIGPKTASFPICLGCHKRIETGINFYRCSKCKWPMCNALCESSNIHIEECEIYSQMENVPNIENNNAKQLGYCLVLPLRTLLLKAKNKNQYNSIESMESHLEENLMSPVYRMFKLTLVPFLKAALKTDISEGEVLKICSIFDTNCFDVRSSEGLVNVRALYPIANLLAHNCKHNTKHTFHDDDYKIVFTATEDIEKGQLLTTTYTQTLWGTLTRREHLKRVKFFDCICDRCKDPTEFGTYAGSIYCSVCKLTINNINNNCPKMISTNPLDPNETWKCEKCDHEIPAKQIIWGNEAVRKEILTMDKSDPRYLEEFLLKYDDVLHPSNYHILEVKYALTQLYGNADGFKLMGMTVKKSIIS